MADANNVFISWSGERSKVAAEAVRDWLPNVLQLAKPWISTVDIEKGARGLEEVARALEGMKVGIICLTPENLRAEWILYEAGALSKTLDAKARVCTLLLAGLQPQDVKAPLGLFQWTKAGDREQMQHLIRTINKNLDDPLPEERVNAAFEKWWPDLEKRLTALPAVPEAPPPARSINEMVADILELSRAMAPDIRAAAREADYSRRAREAEQGLFSTGGVVVGGTVVRNPNVFSTSGNVFLPTGQVRLSDLAGPAAPQAPPKKKKEDPPKGG